MPQIQSAAALIAEIDPALARAFLAKPFHRQALITAFHRGLARSTAYRAKADEIAVALRSAAEAA